MFILNADVGAIFSTNTWDKTPKKGLNVRKTASHTPNTAAFPVEKIFLLST